MRNTTLHTICILGLALLSSVSHAELDPNMEAAVDCSTSNCMFQGNSQASDALRGLSKLPVQAKLQKVNDYVSNPATKVNLDKYPQFAPVGELRKEFSQADGGKKVAVGSAVIVSPCYILTSYHVAAGLDDRKMDGKDYTMTFSAGKGTDQGAFFGHTDATPVLWGNYDGTRNDWALLRMRNCVGTLPSFGWLEASKQENRDLVANKTQIVTVGYSGKDTRGQLSSSIGRVHGTSSEGLLQVDTSVSNQQSGGPALTFEDGRVTIAGLITSDDRLKSEKGVDTFQQWDVAHTNNITSANEVLNRSDVKELLDADKAKWGKANPAEKRNSQPLPSTRVQMASI